MVTKQFWNKSTDQVTACINCLYFNCSFILKQIFVKHTSNFSNDMIKNLVVVFYFAELHLRKRS